jgi:hypothetical protein
MGKPHSADLSHLRVTFPPEGAADRTHRIAHSSLQDVVFTFPVFPWVPEYLEPANPAVGAELDVPVPGHQQWRLVYGTLRLTTDANVANRFVLLQLRSPAGTPVLSISPNTALAASATRVYNYFAETTKTAQISSHATIGIPENGIVLPGWSLHWSVAGIQAGDQISNIDLLIERRPDFAG